ncbi:hypothetical protein BK714_24665 [Bacillus thuringiensis serovar oswaldocruzi]|nr:hypothetical protein BK714_24665 [Bacillus thuringiensis serovar oswaldocruzi]
MRLRLLQNVVVMGIYLLLYISRFKRKFTVVILQVEIPRPVCFTIKSAAVELVLANKFTVEPINVSSNSLIGRSRQL